MKFHALSEISLLNLFCSKNYVYFYNYMLISDSSFGILNYNFFLLPAGHKPETSRRPASRSPSPSSVSQQNTRNEHSSSDFNIAKPKIRPGLYFCEFTHFLQWKQINTLTAFS